MSARVATAVRDEGRPVTVKRAGSAEEAARLRHEAAVLDAARHPGVVELVELVDDGDRVELITAFAGPHSLATARRLPAEQVAGLLAALATVVADLHDAGLVHGRIEPSHVLLGAHGRPVLCGFGSGGRAGQTAMSPADDVAALGALLVTLVSGTGPDLEPIPDQRLPLHRRNRWSGWQRRVLLTVADQASVDEPGRRPTARQLAAAIHEAIPSAVLPEPQPPAASPRWPPVRFIEPAQPPTAPPTDAAPERPPVTRLRPRSDAPTPAPRPRVQHASGGRVRPQWAVPVAAVAGVALIAYGALTLRRPARPSAPTGAQEAVNEADAPPSDDSASLDLVGSTAPILELDGARYAVGQPGDSAVIGDWDCDGRPTAALLRPSTGAVFVFDEWAAPGAQLAVPPTTIVEGATGLAADDVAGTGCSRLVADRSNGERVEITG